jgi:molybdopterin synthase sulfur carrier subunit
MVFQGVDRMEIKIHATLRDAVGKKCVRLDKFSNATIEQILQELISRYPAIVPKLFRDNGELHAGAHILINGRDMRYLNGLETRISAEDEVRIFPAVGGGCS